MKGKFNLLDVNPLELLLLIVAWLIRWLDEKAPVSCAVCGRFRSKKNTRTTRHRVAGQVRVCVPCHRNLHPDEYIGIERKE